MGIINSICSFLGLYNDTFYEEDISLDEITITLNGEDIGDYNQFFIENMSEGELIIPNTKEGFVFASGDQIFVINFNDYTTTDLTIFPKMRVSHPDNLKITLFMKHD